ncbi:MAG: EamA family transporter [Bryobacteraceae bacterium]
MRNHPLFKAYLALAAVCFFWGTTYLGIRVALEMLPPTVLVALRYVLSGGILLVAALLTGARLPRGRELWTTAGYGILMLGVGNGCLAFAEQRISSGLAALFITTSPFWMVGFEALVPGGAKPRWPTVFGMVVGFLGVGFLISPKAGEWDPNLIAGFLLLQVGNFGWSLGSIVTRRAVSTVHSTVSGAIQQLATGLAFAGPALLIPHEPIHWNWRGVAGVAWLVVFGSIVAFSAYLYALDRLPVAVISMYTYVNPLVAVTLGWLVYREPFGLREAAAMVIIFLGVAIVKRTTRH